MHSYIITILISVSLIVLLNWLLSDSINQKNSEHFIITNYPSRFCSDCGNLDRIACNNCTNCGTCYTPNGYKECVAGDEYGPFFRSDCIDYQYNNPMIQPILIPHHSLYYPIFDTDPYYDDYPYLWDYNYWWPDSHRSSGSTENISTTNNVINKENINNDDKRDLRVHDKIESIKLDKVSNNANGIINHHNTSKFSRSSNSNKTDGTGFRGRRNSTSRSGRNST